METVKLLERQRKFVTTPPPTFRYIKYTLHVPTELDPHEVDRYDRHEENRNEDARVDFIRRTPVLDDEGSRGQLIGRCDDVLEPIGIA